MESKASKRVQDIQERCLELAEVTRRRESAQVIQLPLWPEGKRGTPNSFLRSALFAAIQGKDRIFMKDEILFSQQGVTVKFTGEQLNQEDMTVWLALADLARAHPLGTECNFTAYRILQNLGSEDGGRERERLKANIRRLTACLVEINNGRFTYGGSLINDFAIDEQTKNFKITLNKKLIGLFGENDWTALDWQRRKQLKEKPLAQKLHEYYSSHKLPKPVTVDFLHKLTGSRNKQLSDFKRKLKNAFDALVKIGFLKDYKIKGDLVIVDRIPSTIS
jgi:TrfA protein